MGTARNGRGTLEPLRGCADACTEDIKWAVDRVRPNHGKSGQAGMSAEEGSSRCRESAGQKAPHEAAARFRMRSGNKCSTGTNRRRGSKAFKCSKLGTSAVNASGLASPKAAANRREVGGVSAKPQRRKTLSQVRDMMMSMVARSMMRRTVPMSSSALPSTTCSC